MAVLNLHLDLINDHKQISKPVLSSEERLKIIQESIELSEKIDEDFRILDKMCSALDNLVGIQRHIEIYGYSPALEVLVGDIRNYLGISMEADETKTEENKNNTETTDNSKKEKKSGIAGVISQIWTWLCGFLEKVGKWLGLCDKVVTDSTIGDDVTLNASSNYDIDVSPLVYVDGKVVKRVDEIKKLHDKLLNVCKWFLKGAGTANGTTASKEAQDVTISVSGSDISSNSSSNMSTAVINDLSESIKKLKELSTPVKTSISGDKIKELNNTAIEFYRESKKYYDEIKKRFSATKDKLKDGQKTSEEQSKVIGLIKDSFMCLTSALRHVIHVARVTKRIAEPPKKKEEPKQEENKPAEQNTNQEQKPAEGEKKPEENKQPEQKPENK